METTTEDRIDYRAWKDRAETAAREMWTEEGYISHTDLLSAYERGLSPERTAQIYGRLF